MVDTAQTHDAQVARARTSGAFATPAKRRQFYIVLVSLTILCCLFAVGLVAYKNPMPYGTDGFWIIAQRRSKDLLVMGIVAVCQALATVSFQTATNNRIITPSIMGFESLYVAVQTSGIYFFGVAGIVALQGTMQFALQVVLMVAFSLALYGWLLSGKYGNLQIMLLVGIIIGGGLASVSTFMQRLLTPSDFDILTARLFGSVTNADSDYFPLGITLILFAGGGILLRARRLNVIALGRDVSMGLGVRHRSEIMKILFLVSILMAVSTAMVGRMTFLGFLVATLAYAIAGTEDHRYVLPLAVVSAFTVLTGAYFIMRHVFAFASVVSVIIEFVGGTVFLIVILRKGRL